MNAKERRQYEMLLRVRDFARTHSHLFSGSGLAREAFGCINTAVDELTATDLLKLSASVSARADRKARARQALTDLLLKVSRPARVLRARGQTLPGFVLPASRSDQALLTVARQFARDAAGFEADFRGHGMGSTLIAEVAGAFELAVSDREMKRADHTAAMTRIRELLTRALLDVRRLDLIVSNELAGDSVIKAVWQQTRRLGRARHGGSSEAPAPAAVDAPESATVIQMPSREAA
jgi:hypothetical protein